MPRETWLVFVRTMRPMLRNPIAVGFGLLQPTLYLALFGPLLGVVGGGSWQWFVPGLLVMMGLTGTSYGGFGLIPEVKSGVLERLRVTPLSRTSLLLGRVLKDVVLLVVQSVLVVVAALLFGFHTSVGALLAGIALLALLGGAVAAASYAVALKLKHEYLFAPVLSGVVLPLTLLSGVLLPMDLAPGWLYALSRANPLSHVVDAERAIFSADFGGSAALGVAVALGLAALCVLWGTRTFHRESA
jgi:ABC-2 type transport system permease protein